mmetsp:Transcript_103776/g.334598  ORF Transcript_103776/g.334598 Transcript_103776/m.334598 type:complete len:389 (-) Transcript_103776:304-1470(-)
MEAVDLSCPEPFLRCLEDGGVPMKLVQESDVVCLPAKEELRFESHSAGKRSSEPQLCLRWCVLETQVHSGSRARLTTHRLIWYAASKSAWMALRLDGIALVETTGGGIFRQQRCELQFQSGCIIAIRCNDAAWTEELSSSLKAALGACKWRQGSYEVASIGGLQRILGRREDRQHVVDATLEVALADLESLREHAAQTVAAARRVAAHSFGELGEGTGVQRLLQGFGLMGPDGAVVAVGGDLREDIDRDVAHVCAAALEQRGGLGLLLAHDVFCLVNRARGTALVSPDEVMAALRRVATAGGPLRLRSLGSTGAVAASLARTSEGDVDAHLVQMARIGPLSAFRLATELGLTAAEAQYLLRDAEARAALVRDEAPEGVFYYRNFFADY